MSVRSVAVEPAVAVGLWLLTTAVVPDAYTRIANAVTSRSQLKRLVKAVREDTGLRPGILYRRWLRTEQTRHDLVARHQDAYDRLVDSLVSAEARGLLRRRAENRERAGRLVDATIAFFLPTLDASTATAVSDFRAEQRHAELIERLDASTGFEERLAMVPPPAAAVLRGNGAHRGMAERVVDAVLRSEPRDLLMQWTHSRPLWLQDAPAKILLSLAQLAQAFGLRDQAGRLFEETADLGLNPPMWYSRAAFEAQAYGEAERCHGLLTRARAAGGGSYVDFIEAAIRDDWATALAVLGPDEATQDPFIGGLYALALGHRDSEAEIAFLRRMVDGDSDYAHLALRLAHLLLARSIKPSATSRDLDRQDALSLAVRARDARRAWRGDSGSAVEVACQAAIMSGDFKRVIVLGTVQPDGEALPEEAAHPEVQFSVAQAALALGERDLVERVATTTSGFHQALLRAEIAAHGDAAADSVAQQYQDAWSLATSEDEKAMVWTSASANGIDPLPGADELHQRTDELPVLCRASQHIAAERFDEAIALLRPRRTSEAARRLLTNAYVRKGDIDAATRELLDMAQRFANLDHQVRAVEVLLEVDRVADAADLADRTLPLLAASRPERSLLHEVGVAAAHNRHAWVEMETRVRAWITESGADRRRRWLLVMAIYNQADLDRAWQVLKEGGNDFAPETEIETQLWIALHARFRPSSETLTESLRLVDRFPDDPDVRALAVNAFLLTGDDKGDIDESDLARWHALIRDRAENPAPDDTFESIRVPDDPEVLIEAFRPLLEEQAQVVETWLRKLRRELWPYGMLSAVAGRSYTKTLAQRPTGWLPIAAADPATLATELDAAATAVDGGRVIADLSTVVVASYIRDRWLDFLRTFTAVEVVPASRHDAAIAVDEFRPRSNEMLGWDLKAGRPVLYTTDDDVLARLEAQLSWIRDEVSALTVRDQSTDEETKATADIGPWMATFHAAQATGLPLWADDVGLRTLARNEGIPAFGSDSLLRALERRGTLSPEEAASAFEALRNQYCVDLPVERSWIVEVAAEDRWRAGPALLALSRRPLWIRPREAFELWSEIAHAAAADDHLKVAPWVYAAVTGITAAHQNIGQATRLNAGLLAKAAELVGFNPHAFAECAAAAATAASDAAYPDPTEHALAMTLSLLSQRYGTSEAATTVARLGSELSDEHCQGLRRILFGT